MRYMKYFEGLLQLYLHWNRGQIRNNQANYEVSLCSRDSKLKKKQIKSQ